ncbi:hypothetical protein POTOM_010447 [Populus tomentosa]|uniref:DUF7642 domain-containing protein n=1 Tax=Populus tomentosa TaxID=118781 RepID=A0A8X8DCH5_POPTO|nr:hypothetical protein POTOM_010447 [Populus tomentosa]
MILGHTDGLSELGSSRDPLIASPESELNVEDDEEQILYAASFEELAKNHVKYDTIIWISISLLLVLAWGIGIIMLLCFPIRRYMLQKDISSRKLYVTANEIVYKFSRPSILFWRVSTIEKCIPLTLVIDIIIEQGCLQSRYGIHTFRVESIVHGKAAPVDQLQVQGVADPEVLRKVIITEASKNVQDFGKGWNPTLTIEEESLSRVGSLNEGPAVFKSPSKSWKYMFSKLSGGWMVGCGCVTAFIKLTFLKLRDAAYALQMTGSPRYASSEHRGSPRYASSEQRGSPRYASMEHKGLIQGEMLLSKLGEVCESVKFPDKPPIVASACLLICFCKRPSWLSFFFIPENGVSYREVPDFPRKRMKWSKALLDWIIKAQAYYTELLDQPPSQQR